MKYISDKGREEYKDISTEAKKDYTKSLVDKVYTFTRDEAQMKVTKNQNLSIKNSSSRR